MKKTSKSRHFYQGLRFKLLLVSLTLLFIPLTGYQFIQDVDSFQRIAQDQNILTTARSLAMLVQSQSSQLKNSQLISSKTDAAYSAPDLYVHPLGSVPVMDGYDDDWLNLQHNQASYASSGELKFQLLLGETSDHLYLLLKVTDNTPIYSTDLQAQAGNSDQVELTFVNPQGQLRHYLIAAHAPGWVTAYRFYPASELLLPPFIGQRIQGEWQETGTGYNLELKIPRNMLDNRLSIRVLDQNTTEKRQLATSPGNTKNPLGYLIRPSVEIQSILDSSLVPNQRIWVSNRQGLVVASSGSLSNTTPPEQQLPWLLRRLLNLILRHRADITAELSGDSIHLPSKPVMDALQGNSPSWRRRPLASDTLILSAVHPVTQGNQISGVLMVEQTTDAILSIQNNALWRLLTTTFALFLLVSMLLLGFASLLTARIRRLHKQMEKAVTPDGRIVGEIQPGSNADEIGELGRGFAIVLSRLAEYNHYLEAMASRLTHELRTPLTIVRTSLESHAQVTDSKGKQAYITRARDGADRLDLILRQLQEATRLEKAMQQAELSVFDVCELTRFNVENFISIYPDCEFIFQPCDHPCMLSGSPELLSQALEKLVNNALDFHLPGTPVQLQIKQLENHVQLCVSNQGSLLPKDVDPFQSMVSVRKTKTEQPHMGLGLYLVKLIAEFHHGTASASNLPDHSGVSVCFSVAIDKSH